MTATLTTMERLWSSHRSGSTRTDQDAEDLRTSQFHHVQKVLWCCGELGLQYSMLGAQPTLPVLAGCIADVGSATIRLHSEQLLEVNRLSLRA